MVTTKPTIRLAGSAPNLATGGVPRPTILQFAEPDCVLKLLEILRDPQWQTILPRRHASERSPTRRLRLYQPVHRLFHVVLVDAACTGPGEPRLDPKRVEKAGLVIRRVKNNAVQAWMRRGETVLGWRDLPEDAAAGQTDYDPDPDIRTRRALGANRALLSKTSRPDPLEGLRESIHPLFAAPPDVCSLRGKTFFYGMLTPTSDEAIPGASTPPFDEAFVKTRIPEKLQSVSANAESTTLSRQESWTFSGSWNAKRGLLQDPRKEPRCWQPWRASPQRRDRPERPSALWWKKLTAKWTARGREGFGRCRPVGRFFQKARPQRCAEPSSMRSKPAGASRPLGNGGSMGKGPLTS